MLLVYALTRTATSGWGDPTTLAFLAASALLVAAFVAIELRSKAPLLPLRIFRQRTLAAANGIAVIVGVTAFSQFFLLTLYTQQVLHYSAMQTGAGFVVDDARDRRVLERRAEARHPLRHSPGAHARDWCSSRRRWRF